MTGTTNSVSIVRSRCAAGHKALWNEEWGGFPPADFFKGINQQLANILLTLNPATETSDKPVGKLSAEWALELGLTTDVLIGTGGFDAHFGAVGSEVSPGTLSKVMGTSTCDMIVVPKDRLNNQLIEGISGQVDGSIIPDMIGIEAGQSAFGDIYAWYKNLLEWPIKNHFETVEFLDSDVKTRIINEISQSIIQNLTFESEKISIDEPRPIALDWLNGRRTPYANQKLKGSILGLQLGTDAPKIYRSLVEATVFGSKAIVDCLLNQGVEINNIVALGGVAKKSGFIMQMLSDVLNMPIKVVKSEQTCALGGAMFASVVAGVYSNISEAQKEIGKGFDKVFNPIHGNHIKYMYQYNEYKKLGKFTEEYHK